MGVSGNVGALLAAPLPGVNGRIGRSKQRPYHHSMVVLGTASSAPTIIQRSCWARQTAPLPGVNGHVGHSKQRPYGIVLF
ncbi:hypothetical protein HYR99_16295 [Candidatus Poribacteria bacterium]|nr:hypothetical protein [Candidatus Poribacteria bacterium]